MTQPEDQATSDKQLLSGRILIADDEETVRRMLGRVLRSSGHEIVEVGNGGDAVNAVSQSTFDVVLSDINMPGKSGIDLLKAIRSQDLDVPVILITGLPTLESAMQAVEYGAMNYLPKPLELPKVKEIIRHAVRLSRLGRAKREAIQASGEFITGPSDRAGLEAAFERALGHLWSAFQPIVSRNGSVYGYEALMRSRDEILPHPGAMLDAAERLNQLEILGRTMRGLAASQLVQATNSSFLFVNLHPKDLGDPALLDVNAPLSKLARRVVLELTERASLESIGNLKRTVAELRERGYRLAVDDLGAGYAGLTSFAVLEPEVVKLDMSLIRNIDRNTTKQKVVGSMSQLCSDLGMLVVAEGVETAAELDWVLDLGCDLIQGYLIAKPGPGCPGIHWPYH